MSTLFHSLRVQKITHETSDAVSVELEVPESLKEVFQFESGQYLTFRINLNGAEIRRSYSLCVAPYEGLLKVAIKKIAGGVFSTYANEVLKVGDMLETMAPMGRFTLRTQAEQPNYLAIAAGSGITPMLSIIKHALYHQQDSTFTLIYGNRNSQSILFFEELESIKNKYMGRFNLIQVLSREQLDAEILNGRINRNKLVQLKSLIDYKTFSSAYLCGPEGMIHEATDFLTEHGLEKNRVHFELFTTAGAIAQTMQSAVETTADQGPVSQITLTLDGRTTGFPLAYQGVSILDAALKAGADLPYACKGGVCCTCRAKLLKGEVSMDVNYALEAEEVEQGFILTCQAHPLTEEVVVDFDVK